MEKTAIFSGVQKGKSFIVVRRSQPIFRLAPVDIWGDEGFWKLMLISLKLKKVGFQLTK